MSSRYLSSLTIAAGAACLALAAPAEAQRWPHPRPAPSTTTPTSAAAGGAQAGASADANTSAGVTAPAATETATATVAATAGAQANAPEGAAATTPAPPSTEPMTSDEAARQLRPGQDRARDIEEQLLLSEHEQLSLGWRLWAFYVPRFVVELFAHIEPGWEGSLQPATGPEFVYRNGRMDIVLAGMFLGHSAPAGFFRGVDEPGNATERVRPNLWGLYLTSHFLWSIPFHKTFELQIGGGIGVGYIFGDLWRSQAFLDPMTNQYRDCETPGRAPECMSDNNHYTNGSTDPDTGLPVNPSNAYREPNWFGRGYVPAVMPFISIPHIGLHFRPHRNFDLRAEGGWALYGFYGGGSLHFVF